MRETQMYRASLTLAQLRTPTKKAIGNGDFRNSSTVTLHRSKTTLKHVPVIEDIDMRDVITTHINDLTTGDLFFRSDHWYEYISHKLILSRKTSSHYYKLSAIDKATNKEVTLLADAKYDTHVLVKWSHNAK